MPRIPVRTTPYHSLPRCTRHYKSKRELALKALSKASFINGNQFVIAWISPKGEVDVFASELLQDAIKAPDGAGVLNRAELEREAGRIKGVMTQRWDEFRRREERGEAVSMADDDEGEGENDDGADGDDADDDDYDPDRTLVESEPGARPGSSSSGSQHALPKGGKLLLLHGNAGNAHGPAPAAGRAATPAPPMHTLTLAPADVEPWYLERFEALQQTACKIVVKAWIKIIEPKKQAKYPYNKGEDARPAWWPVGVKHREPDHLSKLERMNLLTAIIRSPLVTVNRLQLATAEVGTQITPKRQAILRSLYLVAAEEERMRKEALSGELVVHFDTVPPSPSAQSPEGPAKRPHAVYAADNKENLYAAAAAARSGAAKRAKHHQPRLPALSLSTAGANAAAYDAFSPTSAGSPFTFAPQHGSHAAHGHGHGHAHHGISPWREMPPAVPVTGAGAYHAHLAGEMGWGGAGGGAEYGRSPVPSDDRFHHVHHLAPLLSSHAHAHASGAASPVDSPGLAHAPHMAHAGSHHGSGAGTPQPQPQPHSAGYLGARGHPGYFQQQQLDYIHPHEQGAYNYGTPYIAEGGWEGSFAQAS
ncbi:hypothetical protein Q5752_001636 [Cryptotrichosporon argae]